MNYVLETYPVISNKTVRAKDLKALSENRPGFWKVSDSEGNILTHTPRGFFLNKKEISATSAQRFILFKRIFNAPKFSF